MENTGSKVFKKWKKNGETEATIREIEETRQGIAKKIAEVQ